MIIALGSEFTAAGLLMQRWFPGVPVCVFCLLFAALLFGINATSSRMFAETEFWYSFIKVIAVIAMVGVAAGESKDPAPASRGPCALRSCA